MKAKVLRAHRSHHGAVTAPTICQVIHFKNELISFGRWRQCCLRFREEETGLRAHMPGGTAREQAGWGLNPGTWLQIPCLAFATVPHAAGRVLLRPASVHPPPGRGPASGSFPLLRGGGAGRPAAPLEQAHQGLLQPCFRLSGTSAGPVSWAGCWAGRARGSFSFAAILLRAQRAVLRSQVT